MCIRDRVITAPLGKYSTVSLLIIFSVSFVAGQQIDKTSDTKKDFLHYHDRLHRFLCQDLILIDYDNELSFLMI